MRGYCHNKNIQTLYSLTLLVPINKRGGGVYLQVGGGRGLRETNSQWWTFNSFFLSVLERGTENVKAMSPPTKYTFIKEI